jgi:SSS family solute:Na+ symporter
MIGVSYATEPPPPEKLAGLTFQTVNAADRAKTRASWGTPDVVSSGIVLLLIVVAYVYFSG